MFNRLRKHPDMAAGSKAGTPSEFQLLGTLSCLCLCLLLEKVATQVFKSRPGRVYMYCVLTDYYYMNGWSMCVSCQC